MDKNADMAQYKQLAEDFANYATEDRNNEQRMAYAATSIALSLLVLAERLDSIIDEGNHVLRVDPLD